MVCIEDIECVSAQLEGKALGYVKHLLQTNVEITIPRLPEILNTWSHPGIELVKAGHRFEGGGVQHTLIRVKMSRRLQEWRRSGQQGRHTELNELRRYVAVR